MNASQEIIDSLPAEISNEFDWEGTTKMVLDITRSCIVRKDWAKAASYLTTLGFLGVEMEELGLSDLELNLLARHL